MAEVFLTDSVRLDEERFLAAAQLPRRHAFFSDGAAPYHDLLLELEVGRQAGILIAHRYLEVPQDHKFIFRAVELEMLERSARRTTSAPCNLVLEMRIADRFGQANRLSGMSLALDFYVDGTRCAYATGSLLFLPEADYVNLRRHVRAERGLGPVAQSPSRAIPIDPRRVGRCDRRNVVLAEPRPHDEGVTCELVVDEQHPCLFDHALDHVPGALILEAFRQVAVIGATQARKGSPSDLIATRIRADFVRFAELDDRAYVKANVTPVPSGEGGVSVEVSLHQAELLLGSGGVELVSWLPEAK